MQQVAPWDQMGRVCVAAIAEVLPVTVGHPVSQQRLHLQTWQGKPVLPDLCQLLLFFYRIPGILFFLPPRRFFRVSDFQIFVSFFSFFTESRASCFSSLLVVFFGFRIFSSMESSEFSRDLWSNLLFLDVFFFFIVSL